MRLRRGEAGVTLLEVLVVVAIIGISVTATVVNLEPLETPLQAGSALLEGTMRQARVHAIASTSAYRVLPASSGKVKAEFADSCAATSWTLDGRLNLDLPSGVTLESTSWAVCFSSRGISTDNVEIGLQHGTYGSAGIEVLLGGTTQVLQ